MNRATGIRRVRCMFVNGKDLDSGSRESLPLAVVMRWTNYGDDNTGR